ncbi:ATP-binding cassette domain-containing protein [Aminipila butyrica]|uniref:ATP-binding cassette domain-containing protein n=1 Tax=Aminipila butyrica TaxID=433296 RepID=A0A858BX14_9FIRM|nr:ECF transporter S component [Aminipila butyrica]QIB69648.1 ATP-binding cassette domain-containing protein [Aminipila butyrica]
MNRCFDIRNLNFAYPEQTEKTLTDVSFSVEPGEFIALCGPSGCGKSTLLRQLKTVIAPHGARLGDIFFEGKPLQEVSLRDQSARIGFVQQNPDNQLVTDKVWHELAFGLESLGYDTATIRGRVAEMSSFFGIQTWFYKSVKELSGGQKQLLNLASIMAMQPLVLILDEPTSQLDPIAAADFLATVGKINRELGTTVIITEHRLEEVFPLSNRVLVMDRGKLIYQGEPHQVGTALQEHGHSMFMAMPTPLRIFAAVPNKLQCPVTVREGRLWLEEIAKERELAAIPAELKPELKEMPVLELKDLWFKYEKDLPDVIKGLSLQVRPGEFLAVLGGNGTGKTTTLSLIAGINRPYRGKILVQGKDVTGNLRGVLAQIGSLPQNPQALFVKKTVEADLLEVLKERKLSKEQQGEKLERVLKLCRLEQLRTRHPYDLSGGEQQRAALAKVLLLEPQILLLDEPTKGLDAEFKELFAEILQRLLRQGVSLVMVSHDIEFCAKYAHRCAMFFDGNIVTEDTPRAFFSGNSFYTTAANRMARQLLPEAVAAEDVILACGGKVPPGPQLPAEDLYRPDKVVEKANQAPKSHKLPLWRRILAGAAGICALTLAYVALQGSQIIQLEPLEQSIYFIASLVVLALAISQRSQQPIEVIQIQKEKRRLSKRTVAAAVMILLAIPLTLYVGVFYFGDRKYYFISLLIILETMLPFVLAFEGRKPQARELIILAVLCALGVAGRAAFFMLPQFKPVAAMVIIAGVAFGGEAGFLVGAITMLTSNMLYGQGPWTPWQMFAMGVIGFLAGILFRKGLLLRGRLPLCVFGGLAVLVIYGGLMNPATVLTYNANPTWPMFVAAYVLGLPFDLVHAAATVIFLWFMSQSMLEKLDRIKVKYGLMDQ